MANLQFFFLTCATARQALLLLLFFNEFSCLMKKLFYFVFTLLTLLHSDLISAVDTLAVKPLRVYQFEIREEIAPPVWRTTQKAFEKARALDAGLILIHMNTYGGMVDAADSIRTKILNSKIPVYVFIDNNAASAGALISIACDSIYMKEGANIGAATVVNQTGEVVPDKYQSYMRSMMRSTAEATGRNPDVAEAMVDPSIFVAGISDSGKVLTFTTSEAIRHGFCQGMASSPQDVLFRAGHSNVEIIHHHLTGLDRVINWLINPYVSGLLIMLIIGGLYFELQTPGIGFPLGASVVAAMLYFAPLYLEGLATHIEIIIFVVGIVLILLEVFVIPGFGVAGVLGILFTITGLTLAMVESVGDTPFQISFAPLAKAFFIVTSSVLLALAGSMYLGQRFLKSRRFGYLALQAVQNKEEGFTSTVLNYSALIGKTGTAHTDLRPAGKVMIEGDVYDATLENGYAEKGESVLVRSFSMGQLLVRKSSKS